MADFEKKFESDAKLPKACIDRVVLNTLPSNISISKDQRFSLLDYGVAFVQFISIGAYEMCEKKRKKTITPEHIFQALKKLGFENYVDKCEETFKEYQSLASKRPSKKNALEDSGLTMKELLDKQKELFQKAKEQMDKSVLDENDSE